MADMPAKIWATCNGMSTRLPDGRRQFIGGWSEDKDRPRAEAFIRADLVEQMAAALRELTEAKALSGVRQQVAGWNGEGRDEPYKERHPARLGATLPKTNCGAVYELDEAMQRANAILQAYEAAQPANQAEAR